MTTRQDIQKFDPGAVVDLFTVDASTIEGGVFYFTNQVNELLQPIVWNGNTHAALPCGGEGWAKSVSGAAPRPIFKLDNTQKAVQSAVLAAGDLIGALLTRTQVFARYLDAVNFAGGVNPTANPTQILSVDVYVIDKLLKHDKREFQWELCWAMDLPGLKLPRQQVLRDFGFPGVGLNRA